MTNVLVKVSVLISICLISLTDGVGSRDMMPGISVRDADRDSPGSRDQPRWVGRGRGRPQSPRQPISFPDISEMYEPPIDTNDTTEPVFELPDDMDEMSMELSMMMSTVESVEELSRMLGFTEPMEEEEEEGFNNYTSDGTIAARSGFADYHDVEDAMNAVCDPEKQTVKLDLPKEPGVFYFPPCVRLLRCGGCCPNKKLECKPKSFRPITLKLMRIQKGSSGISDRSVGQQGRGRGRGSSRPRRNMVRKSFKLQEKHHVSCTCQCRVEASDCIPGLQEHKECQCHCVNKDEEKKCSASSVKHYWDKDLCACRCHDTKEMQKCSTTQTFDPSTCSCVARLESGSHLTGRSGFEANARLGSDEEENRIRRLSAAGGRITFGGR